MSAYDSSDFFTDLIAAYRERLRAHGLSDAESGEYAKTMIVELSNRLTRAGCEELMKSEYVATRMVAIPCGSVIDRL